MLSKNFISLLESMKSPYNEIDEDKDARVERREERRKERRENKFGVSTNSTDGTTAEVEGSSDFKIRPFMRAVEQLKSQVQSEIFNIEQNINNRESGHQSASAYKSKFNTILEIITKIITKMSAIKGKEGKNLEDKDAADIKIFRGLYSTASNDFLAAQKEWSEKKLEDENKYLSDLKDTDTNKLLISANKSFDEAKAMLNDLIRNSQLLGNDKKVGIDKEGTGNLATGDIIKGGKYAKDSKEGKIVIEVKKTIYAKFKKYLGKTKDWGIVYKSGVDNVSGTLLANTQNVIKGVKGGLVDDYPELKSDKTGNITPAFIAAINKVTEGKENTSGRLITFENFIKSKVNEEFNQAEAEAAMKPTEYKKKEETKKEDTKKDDPKEEATKKDEVTEFTSEEAKKMTLIADNLLISANKKIQAFYKDASNFTEFTGKIDDDESAAIVYIFGSTYEDKDSWFYKNIRRKYTKPAYATVNKLKKGGDKYEEYYLHLIAGIKKIRKLYGVLKVKTIGGSFTDDHKWSYTNLDGDKSNYKVNTDF